MIFFETFVFLHSFSFSEAKTCRISLKVQMWKSPKIEFLSKKRKIERDFFFGFFLNGRRMKKMPKNRKKMPENP